MFFMGEKNDRERIGLVQVYTGSGKGKTTAALGLALRAAGNKMRTYFAQFLKSKPSGEQEAIELLAPYVTLEQFGSPGWVLEKGGTPEQRAAAAAGLVAAGVALREGAYDIVVLDEVNVAIDLELLELDQVLELIEERAPHVELVLTGRHAPQAIIDRADLVTEMREVRHPHNRGVPARAGIEF
jgi:cob(I)alamin adenosyltransferase